MKIVLNDCYGGFGLSDTAEDLYAEKSGFKLYRYKQTKYKHCDGEVAYERCKPGEEKGIFTCTMKKDLGDSFSDYPSESYFYSGGLERTDPILIEVVQELGVEAASGDLSELKIVDVPDDVSWEIDDYDGIEHRAESHRTWG